MQARRASEGIRIATLTKTAAILKSTSEICICRAKHDWDAVLFVPTAPLLAAVHEIGKPIVGVPRSVPEGLSARVFRTCAVEPGMDCLCKIQTQLFDRRIFLRGVIMMNWQDRIGFDPGILGGKPVIKGTRLAVEKIVELMATGWSEQQIIENYPGLTHDDMSACLFYAIEVLKSERVVALASPE
jgi:uncharacterized protein (DUF433 family)